MGMPKGKHFVKSKVRLLNPLDSPPSGQGGIFCSNTSLGKSLTIFKQIF